MRRPLAEAGLPLDREASRAVSKRVRELRTAAGFDQAAVAEALELSQPMVSLLESGRARWRERDADRAAAFFGVTLGDLLGGVSLAYGRRYGPRRKAVPAGTGEGGAAA